MNKNFFCNKRYDISFADFSKMVRLILPTNYECCEKRGIYKRDYMPCNIIELKNKSTCETFNIYSWLGQKGLTILADTEFATSICIEILSNVKQNPEDYAMLQFDLIDENTLIDEIKSEFLVYHQINSSENTSKYIIKEYNNDECSLEFFYNPDCLRLYGARTSLFVFVQLAIDKLSKK